MLVRLTRSAAIAADGRHVTHHQKGEVLDLPESLAKSLVRDKIAQPSKEEPEDNRASDSEPAKASGKASDTQPTAKKKYEERPAKADDQR